MVKQMNLWNQLIFLNENLEKNSYNIQKNMKDIQNINANINEIKLNIRDIISNMKSYNLTQTLNSKVACLIFSPRKKYSKNYCKKWKCG